MKQTVLFALTLFCFLTAMGQNRAFAHPTVPSGQVSFNFDVSGFVTGTNLKVFDTDYYYAAFGISNADFSWVDAWQSQLVVLGQTGDSHQTIDWQMNKTYSLTPGQTYLVSWIVQTVGVSYDGQWSGKIKGQMDSDGVAWLDGTNGAYAEAVNGLGFHFTHVDDFAQGPSFAYATVDLGDGIYTDSWARTNFVWMQSELSLDPGAGWSSTSGYALFVGTFEVTPDVLPVPAPGGWILGAFGAVIVGWLRGRKTL